eukprot:jgi/Mesvir1/15685/Mv03277-RA.1
MGYARGYSRTQVLKKGQNGCTPNVLLGRPSKTRKRLIMSARTHVPPSRPASPVSEDDLAGMVDLHSNLGGKGKVAGDKKDRDDKNDSDDKMVDSGDDDPASRVVHTWVPPT